MAPHISCTLLCLLMLLYFNGNDGTVGARLLQSDPRPTKIFVFGDSYADTGNTNKTVTSSWKVPYGMTYPGISTGRYSDGRVLTDYFARFLGIKTPIPYRVMNIEPKRTRYGVNFAYGGTGVFKTFSSDPNMTVQIDFFQKMINNSVYSSVDLQSAVALVVLSGNDYAYFISKNSSSQALQEFIPTVVSQLVINIQRVLEMGVKKVVVTTLQPLGCLPRATIDTSFKSCNQAENAAVQFHNILLQQAVAKLNNGTTQGSSAPLVVLDLYTTFMSVLQNNTTHHGSMKFKNLLKLCCAGTSNATVCGSTGTNGEKLYTVCDEPELSFFWDTVHPTQQGWHAIYMALQATLKENFPRF